MADDEAPPLADAADDIVDQAVDALDSAAAAASAAAGFAHPAAVPNPRFHALIAALRIERAAPDILPFEGDMVAELSSQLSAQKSALESANKLELAKNAAVADLYEADVARVRYFLASYLRTRLAKIHRWAAYIDASDDILGRLSEAEQAFHRKLVVERAGCLQDTFLAQLPPSLDSLEPQAAKLQEGPNTAVHVYASIEEDLGFVPVGDETVKLSAGSKVAIQYRFVAPYLASKKVTLR